MSKVFLPPFGSFPLLVILLLVILDLVLRGVALWRSARAGQNIWFIVLFILNTAGILPAVYLLFFQHKTARK